MNTGKAYKNVFPEIKKVLPVTIDEEMSKTIQGLSKEECPVLFILIPSGTGASLSADNVRENNLCVIFLMSKYDPQRKGAYETIEEVQPVMERIKQMLIEDSATGCPVTKELDLTSLSTLPESGFTGRLWGGAWLSHLKQDSN
ncbi:hypothetical protein NXW89_31565 [Bacteroides thetaiotaomicron]|nr:hypothetical protein [Bacteroides thetaiotaomicron]